MRPPYEPGRVRYHHTRGDSPGAVNDERDASLPSFDAWRDDTPPPASPPPPIPPHDERPWGEPSRV
jgi:penicillin-binding protein 1A